MSNNLNEAVKADLKEQYDLGEFTKYSEELAQIIKPMPTLVFGKIVRAAYSEGFAYMSIPRMASELGLDRGTVEKSIKVLLEKKIIVDTSKKNWDRYQEILAEQERNARKKGKKPYRKSSRYSKPIRLYTPNMEVYRSLVAEGVVIKKYSYEEVFERGKTPIQDDDEFLNGEKPQQFDEKPQQFVDISQQSDEKSQQCDDISQQNDEKSANMVGKTPMNRECNRENNREINKESNRENNKEDQYTSSATAEPGNDSATPLDSFEDDSPDEKSKLVKQIDELLEKLSDENRKKAAKVAQDRGLNLHYQRIENLNELNSIIKLLSKYLDK